MFYRKTVKLVYDDESFEIERPMIGNQLLLKLKELMHEVGVYLLFII